MTWWPRVKLVGVTAGGLLFLAILTQNYLQRQLDSYLRPPLPGRPPITLRDIVMVGREKGEKRWQVEAPSVVVGSDKKEVFYKGELTGMLFQNGTPWLRIRGTFLRMQMSTKSFRILEGVEIERAGVGQHDRMQTEELAWDAVTGEFHSGGPVVVRSQAGTFRAARLSGNSRAGVVTFEGVSSEVDPGKLDPAKRPTVQP